MGMPVRAERADRVEAHVRDLAARLGPGALLPGERELATACGVSRMTVRRALETLEHRRLVERRHGAGTYVRPPAPAQPLMATSFGEDMHRRGYRPGGRLLAAHDAAADAALAARLEIAEGAHVLVARRLRLADDAPIAVETLHVPAERAAGLARGRPARARSTRCWPSGSTATSPRGTQAVEPVVPAADVAGLLGVPEGSAAFRFAALRATSTARSWSSSTRSTGPTATSSRSRSPRRRWWPVSAPARARGAGGSRPQPRPGSRRA